MSEKEVLCDLIENYIKIANNSNNTLDDYISIISLIKLLQLEYREYANYFEKYINLFREKGILDQYQLNFSNVTKKIFLRNKFHPNIDLAEEMLYGFFNECSSRPMHYLIIFGLCGKPKTKKQKYIMAHLFDANWSSFYKQGIYYINDYLNNGVLIKTNYLNNNILEKIRSKNTEEYQMYKRLASCYAYNKEYDKSINCLKKCINNVKKTQLNKKMIISELNTQISQYKIRINYPYIRKEILEMFNIDIKKFNKLIKNIKNDPKFNYEKYYSKETIEYIKNNLM